MQATDHSTAPTTQSVRADCEANVRLLLPSVVCPDLTAGLFVRSVYSLQTADVQTTKML